jgi:hypothetical protein
MTWSADSANASATPLQWKGTIYQTTYRPATEELLVGDPPPDMGTPVWVTPTVFIPFGDNPVPQKATGPSGWLCPACGRGNSPYTSTCPCIPIPMVVTC